MTRYLIISHLFLILIFSTAQYTHAQVSNRFSINKSGDEVTDFYAGVIWRRCTEGQTWTGMNCTGAYKYHSWESALSLAKQMSVQTGFAWRLPNIKELQSLVDRKLINPAIDTTVFPDNPPTWFWTSTPSVNDKSYVWVVYFYDGYFYKSYRMNNNLAVRLVRDNF